ncbi:MAG: formylglycine-generating enzyme family protein [Saprospiraceae bacterium]
MSRHISAFFSLLQHRQYFFACCLLFCSTWPMKAQHTSCCLMSKQKGQAAFDREDYEDAIRFWSSGKKCSDAAKCPELDALIQKARGRQHKKNTAAGQQQKTGQARQREIAPNACDEAYETIKAADTKAAYQKFLKQYPDCRHVASARRRIAEIDKSAQTASARAVALPDMARIPGGSFTMGCTSEQQGCDGDEKPAFRVTVSDFYLGLYEVTFEEYDAFCKSEGRQKPGDQGWGRGKRPAINISWCDATAYCNWLSAQHGYEPCYAGSCEDIRCDFTKNGYRLPTEAEWEYAARGGGKSVLFGNGKDVADAREMNFDARAEYKKACSVIGEYRGKTVPVGSLNTPNALGLHDMSGNVWEWCWDRKGPYTADAKTNPRGLGEGAERVFRGGGWSFDPLVCRVSFRYAGAPTLRGSGIGFRLARN